MKIKTLRLKALAVNKGYTCTDLADISGVSRNTVSNIYNGKSCSLTTAAKLSKALGISLEEIADEC